MSATKRTTMSYEFDGTVLAIEEADGTVHRFDFADLPDDLDANFLELGRKTKLANFAASAKAAGKDRMDMIREGWEQLLAGDWAAERVGGGPTVSAEVEALAEIKKASVAAIQKALRGYDKDQRAKILGSKAVQDRAAKIKAARAENDVDLSDLS